MNIIQALKKPIIWLLRPRRYEHLYRAARDLRPRTILEIGTWNGERALRLIRLAAGGGETGGISYYGFDLFDGMTDEKFIEEISKMPPSRDEVAAKLAGTGARIHLYQGDTTETLPTAVPDLPPMDLVFIDGGHSVRTITSDWEATRPLMHDRTVVIFDDYWPDRTDEGAKPVVDAIDRDLYDVQVLEPQDKFRKEHGTLTVQFARVTLRADTARG